jgi:hypothetical protein
MPAPAVMIKKLALDIADAAKLIRFDDMN